VWQKTSGKAGRRMAMVVDGYGQKRFMDLRLRNAFDGPLILTNGQRAMFVYCSRDMVW